MADRSAIEWTDASWNPIRARHQETGAIGWHCVHVSEGCRYCYAETFNRRLGTGVAYRPDAPVELYLAERMLDQPARWKRPRCVFVGSMTDIMLAPFDMVRRIFTAMRDAPWHRYQVLTKRPGHLLDYILSGQQRALGVLSHVWLGCSAEDQDALDARGRIMATIAALGWPTWCSAEPLLGPLSIAEHGWIKWLVVGGESGPKARPMLPRWVDSLRRECEATDTPFFFKQWGAWRPSGESDAAQRDLVGYLALDACDAAGMERVGKAKAGALLHGREWRAMPAEMRARA